MLIHGDAVVEDEALAVEFLFRKFLEVREDSALQLIYVFVTSVFHGGDCFFTPNAARAIQQYVFLFWNGLRFAEVIELPERADARIDCSVEHADACFVDVAGIDDDRIGTFHHPVPFRRRQVRVLERRAFGSIERDDFLADFHEPAWKHAVSGRRLVPRCMREECCDVRFPLPYRFGAPTYRAVNALGRQERKPPHAARFAERMELRAKFGDALLP